ncbi:MAG TPA: ROK family transcriptional regulator [Chloroflexia bacterium]|nr:ROK family transcriptional regulator [Chloroflexia bacterium]
MQSGTNLPRVRDYNQGVILEAIRVEDGISRAEIAEKTGLTKQTVSVIVKRLLEEQLVREAGTMLSTGGKRAVKLKIEPDARYAIGVQIDIDETTFVMMALDGRVIVERQHLNGQGYAPEQLVKEITACIEQLVQDAGVASHKILGLGVGCPGPLNHFQGIVYDPPKLLGWHNVPLKKILEKRTGFPVVVDNDATAAAIGERWIGGAQGVPNFAFIYMGVGIGGGLFINNQIYRGSTTMAGEFGHITLDPNGPACFCGSRGCVEILCAPSVIDQAVQARLAQQEPSILQNTFQEDKDKVDYTLICQAALAGDNLALSEIDLAGWRIGCAAVSMVNLLDVELIVLGGKAFRGVGELYRHKIQQVLDEWLMARDRREIKVELSAAGEKAVAVGAASLVLHELFSPRLSSLTPVEYTA